MVDRIGQGGALAREAIQAALKAQGGPAADQVRPAVDAPAQAGLGAQAPDAGSRTDFASKLEIGLQAIDAEIKKAENLPADFVTGKIEDFHEVAVQLKTAEFSLRYALEIRNKLIDAYREVMRMSV